MSMIASFFSMQKCEVTNVEKYSREFLDEHTTGLISLLKVTNLSFFFKYKDIVFSLNTSEPYPSAYNLTYLFLQTFESINWSIGTFVGLEKSRRVDLGKMHRKREGRKKMRVEFFLVGGVRR